MKLTSKKILPLFVMILLLAGCNYPVSTTPTFPTSIAVTIFPADTATPTVGASATGLPTLGNVTVTPSEVPPADTLAPTQTQIPQVSPNPTQPANTVAPTSTPIGGTSGIPNYLDDRSTAEGVIRSLFNAIDRKEYLRAYSYWNSTNVSSFSTFQAGYQSTVSVQVTTGVTGGSAGAGQLYYTLPVVLQALDTSGNTQVFSGCYILHLAQPAIQMTPPFQGLSIESGKLSQAAAGADKAALLANGCNYPGAPGSTTINPAPTTTPNDISSANYLDDRSDPVAVLKSLFNAINRKEYLRAYSYWQSSATDLPSFDKFMAGYQDTASVTASFGTPAGDAGAGQLYYSVPTVLVAKTTTGATQTFSGCYVLHLAQPAIQATPPFAPLGIRSANVSQVANGSDVAGLLASACPAQ